MKGLTRLHFLHTLGFVSASPRGPRARRGGPKVPRTVPTTGTVNGLAPLRSTVCNHRTPAFRGGHREGSTTNEILGAGCQALRTETPLEPRRNRVLRSRASKSRLQKLFPAEVQLSLNREGGWKKEKDTERPGDQGSFFQPLSLWPDEEEGDGHRGNESQRTT